MFKDASGLEQEEEEEEVAEPEQLPGRTPPILLLLHPCPSALDSDALLLEPS